LKNGEDYTADGFYKKFKKYEKENPALGYLVFFGSEERKSHVGFCIDDIHMAELRGFEPPTS